MIIVSDTTPISELAKVGKLGLLKDLFSEVIIPTEVYLELTSGTHPAAEMMAKINWIESRNVLEGQKIKALQAQTNLDLGESAAILLAEELKASQLLVDEKAARRVALTRQLPVIGTVGVLILAKQQGLITSAGDVLRSWIDNGTRISERLYEQALILSEETDLVT